jgi:hypothetical protein
MTNRATHLLACFASVVSFASMERPAFAQQSRALTTTTTTLSFSPASPSFGSPVILTATVVPGSPTGTVTFYDGPRILGDAGILTNTAHLTTIALGPGAHSLTAYYGGDSSNKPSLSAKVPVTVSSGGGGGFVPATPSTLMPLGAEIVDVEAADLRNAGKNDLIAVNYNSNNVSVFLGNGDGTFQTPVLYAVGTNPNAAAIADVNGDGIPDILVINQGTNTISVLLGTGTGTFQTAQTVTTLAGPHSIVVADFNGDGRPDIAVTSTNHSSVALALNSGTAGFFDAFTTYTTPGTTKGLVVGDFNGDGFPDLAVANYSTTSNYVSIFLGNGDGTLRSPVNYTPGNSPVSVATADFNGDGIPDLAVANKGDNTVSVLLGAGAGAFNTSIAYPAGNGPASVIAVNVGGTSQPDLLVADNGSDNLSLLVGNAGGTFQAATSIPVGMGPRNIVAASFITGNSFVDLAVSNETDNTVSVLLGVPVTSTLLTVTPNPVAPSANVNLTASVTPSSATGTVNFFDGSNLLNSSPVTLSSGVATYITSFTPQQTGSHTLTAVYTPTGPDQGSTSPPVALLVEASSTTALTVSTPTSTLGQTVTFTATVSPNTATGSVIFYDHSANEIGSGLLSNGLTTLTTSVLSAGVHSITARYSGDSGDQTSVSAAVTVTVTPAQAGGYGTPASSLTPGVDSTAVVLADFNADGFADLAVVNYSATGSAGSVSIFLGVGNGTFTSPGTSPFVVGVNPTAIAVGDFNNDGKPDLVVSNYGSSNVSLLLGNGDGTFQPAISVPAGLDPLGIAVGDFNGDGFLDIAVINSGSNQVSIIPGLGNGTFQNAVSTTITAGGLRAITVGDFNFDGKPDVAITATGGVIVAFGNGNGTFSNAVDYVTGTGTFAVTSGYFVNASPTLQDLVVVNSQDNSVSVLLGGANGTFSAASSYPVGAFPQSAVVADFNGDGFQDIAVANEGSNNVSILYGNGQGGFGAAVNYAGGTAPVALAAGSFNATGQTDLAVIDYSSGSVSNPDGVVGIYLALLGSTTSLSVSPNPDTAGVPVTFTATVTPSAATGSVTFMDGINVEGTSPLVSGTATLTVSLPSGVQSLTAVYSGDTVYGQSTSPAVLDSIAQQAIAVSMTATPNPSALRQAVTLAATVNNTNATGYVSFYDGTGNVVGAGVVSAGQAQLVTAALPAGSSQLYARYDGDVNDAPAISAAVPFAVAAAPGFGLGNPTSFAVGTAPVSVTAADFNLDGRVDLAVANSTGNSVSILLGNGDGTFASGVTLNAGTLPTGVATTDFNGDGRPDLAVSNSVTGNVTVFTGNGDGTFSAGTSYGAGAAPSSIAIADFNNDGKSDVIVSNSSGGSVSFIYGNGDGTLGTTATIPVGVTNSFVAAGDFNNDGNADIAVADTNTSVVWILLGRGNGQFQAPVSYKAGTTPVGIAVGDFNGDGKLDLAIANSASGNITVLLGNGDGSFQAAVQYSTGSGTQSVAVGDFNGDGILDLAATNQGGNVEVLIGNGNGTFQNAFAFPASASPVSLVVNNFNGDGKDQVAVANTSINAVSVLLDAPAALAAFGGSGQSTNVGSAFAAPLQVKATGFGLPVAGVTVSFAAPASGPSATFSGTGLTATAVTGSNGVATSPALSANQNVGLYNVIASVGAATVAFPLTNKASSCIFTVTGGPLAFDSNGGSVTLNVTANFGTCSWAASTDSSSWVTLSSTGATGNGSVMVVVAPNSSGAPRSGNVFVAGQTLPVTETLTTQIFADVPPSAYYFDAANLLYTYGITSGCSTGPLDYCPLNDVTRAQMAIFIVRSVWGSTPYTPPATQIFSDVPPGSFGYAEIQELSALGITSGCAVGLFCPTANITRQQMAVFIINARLGANLPFEFPATPYFTDVPTGAFAFDQIQRMRQDNITTGCAPTAFCPTSYVTRGDMAIFIMRGEFNQLLPSGTPLITSVSPNTLADSQGATLTITGVNTSFQQGITLVNPIPGVTFSVPTVTSPTSLTVQAVVSDSATAQPWPIEVITATQIAILPNGFVVQ